jgi:Na+/H+ antiporter NhaC
MDAGMHRSGTVLPAVLLVLAIAPFAAGAVENDGEPTSPTVTLETPDLVVGGVPFEVAARWSGTEPGLFRLEVVDEDGSDSIHDTLIRIDAHGVGRAELEVPAGRWWLRATSAADPAAASVRQAVRSVPGWWTLAPPVVAILLALVFRQVVPALLAGVWLGAAIVHGGVGVGLLRTIDAYVLGALADRDHMSILLFSLLLGGMVGVISRAGGTVGLVDVLARKATTSVRGQLTTWLLGVAIFFDDYANTLVVGNSMRPVTDRLRISREKLAYIVDSTAAPVAAIALVTTWIGAEVSYIEGALRGIGSDQDAYFVFLQSIPYNFYPILALIFGFTVAFTRRDFGPMLRAERRAATTGAVLRDGAQPLSDFDSDALRAVDGKPHRWFNAAIPVVVVVAVTLIAQWWTGRAALVAEGDPAGTAALGTLGVRGLGTVFSAGDSYAALLWASFAGCVVAIGLAVVQRILSLERALGAWVQGMKSMLLAFVVLALAWAIAAVCSDLSTAAYVAEFLSGTLDPRLLPALVFLAATGIAFGTGTSWGTMGLLIPLAVPAAVRLTQESGLDPATAHAVFLGATAAVLSGAILGDHCSPISDTTVLSSMASGCDHVDHVRTQLPYALTVGGVAVVCGYVPEALGVSPWICLLLGAAAVGVIVRFAGRPVEAG